MLLSGAMASAGPQDCAYVARAGLCWKGGEPGRGSQGSLQQPPLPPPPFPPSLRSYCRLGAGNAGTNGLRASGGRTGAVGADLAVAAAAGYGASSCPLSPFRTPGPPFGPQESFPVPTSLARPWQAGRPKWPSVIRSRRSGSGPGMGRRLRAYELHEFSSGTNLLKMHVGPGDRDL